MIKVRIINRSGFELPATATPGSAGFDLRAAITESCVLNPGQRMLVSTGLQLELPSGYEAQIRPRSGLALKHGITVLNSPGTIDADYRGTIGVILINLGQEPFTIQPSDRIAQMVFAAVEQAELIETDLLETSSRNDGGFGHSGKN